jgi:hydrogenase/urease accessory protein HupE
LTDVRLELRSDGSFTADVSCDLDALALGVPSEADDAAALAGEIEALSPAERSALVEGLFALLKRRLRVRFDGTPAAFEVSLPQLGQPPAPGALPSALGLVARLRGTVPEGAREVSFFASLAFPPVRLVVVRPGGGAAEVELVERGGASRPLPLAGPAAAPSLVDTLSRYVRLGATHILPFGLDHVLFVAGLALLSERVKPLLAQVTAFTVAHTATLALSSAGIVELPARVVEPAIALSIAYVGLENALSPRLRASRLVLVFAFGLLHGLGFAGVLGELGLPEGRRVTALLAFNAGVEIGQLAVIALVLGVLRLVALAGRERAPIVRAASLAIAAAGFVWTVRRLAG